VGGGSHGSPRRANARLATAAVVTEPADVARHVEVFAALSAVAEFGDGAREVLREIRAGYVADAEGSLRP
jgi:hypothetical protein